MLSVSVEDHTHVSARKVWPQDGGESHKNGEIYSGALWDARGQLGAQAMDRLAFASVPLFHAGTTLLGGRDSTLQAEYHRHLH